jgi:hypothetical protein
MNRRSPTRRQTEQGPQTDVSRRMPLSSPSIGEVGQFGNRAFPRMLNSLRHKRLLVAAVMTAGVVLSVLAIFTPRFETNDDAGMTAITSGHVLVDQPDEHLVFSNVLIGLALKVLYQAAPRVPWYGGYLFVMASLSLAAVAFACLRRISTLDACLTVAVVCVAGPPFLTVLQFTRVAFLATLAGLLLLTALVRDDKPARKTLWAIPFLMAGALIRFNSFLLAVVVLSPLAGWMMWRARTQVGARGAIAVLAGAITVGFALLGFNNWYYSRDEAWRDFYKFNALRTSFTDYGRAEYNDVTAPVFAKVGWTRADVELLREWCFLDHERFNIQTLQTALDGLASRERATEPRSWKELTEILFADTEVLALWACGAIFLLAVRNEGSAWLVCAGCYLVTCGLCVYLYHDFHLPARVFCPAFAACAAVILTLSAGPRSIGRSGPWTRSVLARTAIALLLGALLLWRGIVMFNENGDFLAAHAQADDLMRRLKPRADKLFVIWGAEFPYEHIFLPLNGALPASNFKALGLNSLAATPFTTTRLKEFGVSDLYSILRRRGVYFISNKWENGTLARYFRDHYRLRIGGAAVLTHPALEPAAVYALAITGIAPEPTSETPPGGVLTGGQ